MARITVLGGTGYAGSNIVAVAAQRGHEVVAYSRKEPAEPVPGVEYRTGDVLDESVLDVALTDTDAVVSALSPRGELSGAGVLRNAEKAIATLARGNGIRFGVVGGAGSLFVTAGGPKVVETDDFPAEFKAEAAEMDGVLQDLRAGNPELDWFFVSPAGSFGPWVPGEATGSYRIGGDVLLVDDNGQSNISGADFALAVVKEIEDPAHRRTRFTVAY